MFSEIPKQLNNLEALPDNEIKDFEYNLEASKKTIMSESEKTFSLKINDNEFESKIVKFNFCPKLQKPFQSKNSEDQLCLFCLNQINKLTKKEGKYTTNLILQCFNCHISSEIITTRKHFDYKYEELKQILFDICDNYKKESSVELAKDFSDKSILIIKKKRKQKI